MKKNVDNQFTFSVCTLYTVIIKLKIILLHSILNIIDPKSGSFSLHFFLLKKLSF